MHTTETIRIIILAIGWPILIAGSLYLYVKGKYILRTIDGSILGRLVHALAITMIIETYSLGVVSTVFLYADLADALYVVIPAFFVWLGTFLWAMRVMGVTARDVRPTP